MKTTVRYYYTLAKTAVTQRTSNTKCPQEYGKAGPPHVAGQNAGQHTRSARRYGGSSRGEPHTHRTAPQPRPQGAPKNNYSTYPHGHVYMNIQGSITRQSEKLQVSKCPSTGEKREKTWYRRKEQPTRANVNELPKITPTWKTAHCVSVFLQNIKRQTFRDGRSGVA